MNIFVPKVLKLAPTSREAFTASVAQAEKLSRDEAFDPLAPRDYGYSPDPHESHS
jgi:hypothetical protein